MSLILGDYIEFISGPAFKSKNFTDNSDDIPLVKGDNLAQGYIKWEKSKYWPVKDTEQYEKYYLYPGDIVLAMDRPWVTAGLKFARIKENDPQSLVVQRVARLRATNGMTQDFLHSLVGSKSFEEYIKNIMGGTNVPHISPAQIKAYDFNVDKFSFEKIGLIYKTYTDLIENNRRRIQLLEESARLLYQEWFVQLRFPGHEQVKITDGIPEGWEPTLVPDVIDVNPRTPVEKGKEIWYVPMSSLSETAMTANRADFELRTKHTNVKFKKNDVLLARITPCLENGKTGYAYFLDEDEVACGSTEFIVLRGKRLPSEFVYCLARSYPFRENAIKSMTGSSGRQRVQNSCFDKYSVPLPPNSILEEFVEVVQSNFEQIRNLMTQNAKLAQARDLLLPKLMSGELTI